jgi:excisionase family DNA binding protein
VAASRSGGSHNLANRKAGVSLRFLYYAIQHKDLPTVRVGRCRLITEKALREWLERKTEASVESRAEGV